MRNKRRMTYIALFVILVLICFFLQNLNWETNTHFGAHFHTLIETVAVLVALFVGIMAVIRFYTRMNNAFLFVGSGFLGTALLDGYHTVVTSSLFAEYLPSPPPSLLPWSWIASRLFLSMFLWLSWEREKKIGTEIINERIVYTVTGIATIASFLLFAFVPLPQAYFPGIIFHRPGEFIPAFFFLMALIGYLNKGYWKYDVFEHWLVLSLIVNIMSLMFMSLSGHLFDLMFKAAHILKVAGYLIVLTGLIISTYHLFKQATHSTIVINKANEILQREIRIRTKAEEALKTLNETLEQRVTKRTVELEYSRIAALSIMKDAEETREKEAEVNKKLRKEISQREQMEKELRKSELRLFKFLDAVPAGVFVLDVNGNPYYANRASKEILGRGIVPDVGADQLAEVYKAYVSGTDQEYPADRMPIVRALSGETTTVEDMEIHKPDRVVPLHVTASPIKDIHGQIIYAIAVFIDITERKRTEREIRKLSLAVEQSSVSVMITDTGGNIEYVNPKFSEVTGYTPEEVIGKNPRILKSGETSQEEYKRLWETIISGHEWRGEFHNKKKNGELYWAFVSISSIKDEKGAITHFLAVKEEITDRKRAEKALSQKAEELTRSNTELEQFAYVASHDLQEPLRMVGSYTQLLAKRYKGKLDADADEFIEYAVDGANRMRMLINDLLTYSRVGTRGKPFEPTDCKDVLEKSLINLQIAIEENKALITYDPLPIVMADDVQLTQLFQNLIGNAIKFHNDKPPEIQIKAKRKDAEGMWLFSLRDNGIGIDPQYAERIFLIFQRLHNRGEFAGTGIGLAVCKKIVGRHGGDIWVESELEKGSTFYFTIPILDQAQNDEG